jgi:surfactin synthase thioesterase subunit
MTDAEFVAEVQQRYQGIPKQIRDEPELLAFLLPALRADVELLEGYRYLEDTPLESRITVFGGSDDSMVPWEALEGWQNESSKEVEIRMFDGNHFFVQQQRDAVIGSVTTILRGESVSAIGVGE